ncbi:MAG: hypothetical protein ACRELC_06575 [Gemmatimonadota bacterium]
MLDEERDARLYGRPEEECRSRGRASLGAAGSVLHHLHTAALVREHGVKEIRTADTDFLTVRFLRVVNPLQD